MQYDQYGHVDPNQGFGGGGSYGGGGFGGQGFGGFEDIFDTFFGGGGSSRQDPNAPRQGSDLQYRMHLKFKEAIFGKEAEIEIPREESCDTCDGAALNQERILKNVRIVAVKARLMLSKIRHLVGLLTSVRANIVTVLGKKSRKNVTHVMAQVA